MELMDIWESLIQLSLCNYNHVNILITEDSQCICFIIEFMHGLFQIISAIFKFTSNRIADRLVISLFVCLLNHRYVIMAKLTTCIAQ